MRGCQCSHHVAIIHTPTKQRLFVAAHQARPGHTHKRQPHPPSQLPTGTPTPSPSLRVPDPLLTRLHKAAQCATLAYPLSGGPPQLRPCQLLSLDPGCCRPTQQPSHPPVQCTGLPACQLGQTFTDAAAMVAACGLCFELDVCMSD